MIGILDSDGNTVVLYTYDAWGNCHSEWETYNPIFHINPLRYRGYIFDEEMQLYYVSSRYYSAHLGRWISADAFVSTGQGFTGNNMFVYCGNNPVMFSDPTGMRYEISAGGNLALFNGVDSHLHFNNKPKDKDILERINKTATALKESVELSAGVGLGFDGEIYSSEVLDIEAGISYDLLNIRYSRGKLSLGQYMEQGFSGGFLFYTFGDTEERIMPYSGSWEWQTYESKNAIGFGAGIYIIAGGSFFLGLDIEYFLNSVNSIWRN